MSAFPMDFDDSFFDESDSGLELTSIDTSCRRRRQEATFYQARICEQKWFMEPREYPQSSASPPVRGSVHDMEFITMKHSADLLYSQWKHRDAACLYRKLLELVPSENSGAVRELRDSLARSLLKLGEGESAGKEAEQLVHASQDYDCCAWRLLAQCHEQLHDVKAQVMALQNSASLQRSHSNFWTSLSSAYKNLKSVPTWRNMTSCCCSGAGGSGDGGTSGEKEHVQGGGESSESLMHTILSRTVQLFRPYFSWRVNIAHNNVSRQENADSINNDSKELRKQQQLQHPTPSNTRAENHSEDLSCGVYISSSPTCTKPCPFYGSLSGGFTSGSEYISIVLCNSSRSSSRCKEADDRDYLPSPSPSHTPLPAPQFCLDHSLFVVLVRGLVSPKDIVEQLQKQSPSSLASLDLLLNTFSAMSECSCLLWARQLLLYAVRCSHSFPKQSLLLQLQEVEVQLEACPSTIRVYLLSHLSKKSSSNSPCLWVTVFFIPTRKRFYRLLSERSSSNETAEGYKCTVSHYIHWEAHLDYHNNSTEVFDETD